MSHAETLFLGISFGKDDLVIPEEKDPLIQETQKLVNSLESQYQEGLITEREKYNKVVGLWSTCTDKVAKAMNNVFQLVGTVGARAKGSNINVAKNQLVCPKCHFGGLANDAP